MANYGLKAVQQGKNINSLEPRDFIFNSKYGSVKIVQEPPYKVPLTASINGSSNKTITIPHNLGFPPMFMVFWEGLLNSGRWYCGYALTGLEGSSDPISLYPPDTKSDNVNVYLTFTNSDAGSQSFRYYYYIFGDSG